MRNFVLFALLLSMSFLSVACGSTTQAEDTKTIVLDESLVDKDSEVSFYVEESGNNGIPETRRVYPDKSTIKICEKCQLQVSVGGLGGQIGKCDSAKAFPFHLWKAKSNSYSMPRFGDLVYYDPAVHFKLEKSFWRCQEINSEVKYVTDKGDEKYTYRMYLSLNEISITQGYQSPDKVDGFQVEAGTNLNQALTKLLAKSQSDLTLRELVEKKEDEKLKKHLAQIATDEIDFFKPKMTANGVNYNPIEMFQISLKRKDKTIRTTD